MWEILLLVFQRWLDSTTGGGILLAHGCWYGYDFLVVPLWVVNCTCASQQRACGRSASGACMRVELFAGRPCARTCKGCQCDGGMLMSALDAMGHTWSIGRFWDGLLWEDASKCALMVTLDLLVRCACMPCRAWVGQ